MQLFLTTLIAEHEFKEHGKKLVHVNTLFSTCKVFLQRTLKKACLISIAKQQFSLYFDQ